MRARADAARAENPDLACLVDSWLMCAQVLAADGENPFAIDNLVKAWLTIAGQLAEPEVPLSGDQVKTWLSMAGQILAEEQAK